MKHISIAVACLVVSAVAASAQSTSTTPTKTGYLIPGCTYYVIDVRTDRMTKYCDRTQAKNARQFWRDQDRHATGSGAGN